MKTIKTALPLPAQVMVEFFKNKKGVFFEIDYATSVANLRTPQAILNYVANLKLNASLQVDKVPVELLASYSVMRDVVQIEQLTRIHANLLYFCKYGKVLYEDTLELFPLESIVEYVQANSHDVMVQLALLNSIPLFVATSVDADPDTVRCEHELVKVVDTELRPAISVNLFQLFSYEEFLVMFLEQNVPIEQQVYFKPHYDTNMYGGKTMFGSFAVEGNLYFGLCQYLHEMQRDGVSRFNLTRLYAGLMNLTNDVKGLKDLNDMVNEAGSVAALLNLTRRDQAAVNRQVRRDKKRAKREVANVQP